jgi:hypothetical protein
MNLTGLDLIDLAEKGVVAISVVVVVFAIGLEILWQVRTRGSADEEKGHE